MNKLHSLAFYALVAPAITFSSAAVLAQQSAGEDTDREQQSSQSDRGTTLTTGQDLDHEQQRNDRDQSTTRATPLTSRNEQNPDRAGRADSQTAAEHRNMREEHSRMENRGFMSSAPVNGMQVSNLIGADVKTSGDEDVGSVDDLIIGEDGQIVAIVIGVGGFLGMGQKDVAIGWDDVTRSGDSDELELRIDKTREGLRDAPEFESEE